MYFYPALHIPDGFLSVPVSALGWIVAIAVIELARRRHRTSDEQIPLMGILAAFIFAAQMINFPVAGGTSGHLLGGALVAILLGPWAAVLVMTAVVVVQALLFQDGGLLAMGFNIVNMGILTVFVGYGIYRLFPKREVGAFVGAWVGVEIAAIATALQLAASNTSPLDIALPAMVGVHALIGIGEGLITVGALLFIQQTRPDLLTSTAHPRAGWVLASMAIILVVVIAAPLASSSPDGLERVAEDHAFIHEAQDSLYEILPDYTVPLVEDEAATTILAGLIGVMIVSAVGMTMARTGKEP